jgi:hypothetical protein
MYLGKAYDILCPWGWLFPERAEGQISPEKCCLYLETTLMIARKTNISNTKFMFTSFKLEMHHMTFSKESLTLFI